MLFRQLISRIRYNYCVYDVGGTHFWFRVDLNTRQRNTEKHSKTKILKNKMNRTVYVLNLHTVAGKPKVTSPDSLSECTSTSKQQSRCVELHNKVLYKHDVN